MNITVYTDGAAKGNPGPGGYGIVLMSGEYYKELAEGFLTGQNAMALMNQFPTSLELSEAVSKMSPQTRNALAQFLRNYTMSPSPAGPTE